MRVSANGGEPEVLVSVDSAAGEVNVAYPDLLPDGDTLLFGVTSGGGVDNTQIVTQSISTGERRLLLTGGLPVRYLTTGHLVYFREGVLLAAPFDLEQGELTGGSVALVEGVASRTLGVRAGISASGSLVYVSGPSGAAARILALVDRSGVVEPLNVRPAPYVSPRLSPDGTQLAVQTIEDDGQSVVWVYDLSGDTAIRQLTQEGNNSRPIWTPDGERLTFASDRDGTTSIWWQPADGSGVAERLTTAEEGTEHWPESWSPDGNVLSFAVARGGDFSIWTLSLDSGATPEVFYHLPESIVASGLRGGFGSIFSPDGKWLAYGSGEGGAAQVFVQPFPAVPGVRHRITQNTGAMPLWSPDGSELFYRPSPSVLRILRGVDVSTEPVFSFSNERTLPIEGFVIVGNHRDYDITPDGESFLMVFPADRVDAGESAQPRINIVLNWFEELKERVPVP